MKTRLLALFTVTMIACSFNNADAQKKDDDEAYSKSMPTPAETIHITQTF